MPKKLGTLSVTNAQYEVVIELIKDRKFPQACKTMHDYGLHFDYRCQPWIRERYITLKEAFNIVQQLRLKYNV